MTSQRHRQGCGRGARAFVVVPRREVSCAGTASASGSGGIRALVGRLHDRGARAIVTPRRRAQPRRRRRAPRPSGGRERGSDRRLPRRALRGVGSERVTRRQRDRARAPRTRRGACAHGAGRPARGPRTAPARDRRGVQTWATMARRGAATEACTCDAPWVRSISIPPLRCSCGTRPSRPRGDYAGPSSCTARWRAAPPVAGGRHVLVAETLNTQRFRSKRWGVMRGGTAYRQALAMTARSG